MVPLVEKGRKREKKGQSMEKSVQNLFMFYHDESLQIPEEEKAFERDSFLEMAVVHHLPVGTGARRGELGLVWGG